MQIYSIVCMCDANMQYCAETVISGLLSLVLYHELHSDMCITPYMFLNSYMTMFHVFDQFL